MTKNRDEIDEYYWKHELCYPKLDNDLSVVFTENGNSIDSIQLTYIRFHSLPLLMLAKDIDCEKASEWFETEYSQEISNYFYIRRATNCDRKIKEGKLVRAYYFLSPYLLLNFDVKRRKVFFLFQDLRLEEVETLQKVIRDKFIV